MESKLFFSLFCLLQLACVSVAGAGNPPKIFNVKDFGAAGDGKADDSQALLNAWKGACEWKGRILERVIVLIPEGTFLIGQVELRGDDCKGPMVVQVTGLVRAPELDKFKDDSDTWISFKDVTGLTLTGGGTFDGQGAKAWLCKKKRTCKLLPTSLKFSSVRDGIISNISSIDSKSFHLKISESCSNMTLVGLHITAPGKSPNTDGIHIGDSAGVTISGSFIGTGDDCISIGPGSSDISISGVFCGPGHGISVGSLGKEENEKNVKGVTVSNCTLTGTTNGLRIKSWQSSPSTSSAFNFTYENIVMDNVSNPIIINQKYCDRASERPCNTATPSLVKISDVHFRNITGISASEIAVKLDCSERFPCQNVELRDIDLKFNGGKPSTAVCSNVKPITSGRQIPPPCVVHEFIASS